MFYQLGPHRVDLTRAIYPRRVVQQRKQNSHQFVFSTKANPKTAPRRHSANTCALLIMRIIDFNASINKHWLSPLHPQGEVCLRQSYYLKKVLMLAANATELVSTESEVLNMQLVPNVTRFNLNRRHNVVEWRFWCT